MSTKAKDNKPKDLVHKVVDQIAKDFLAWETGYLTDKDGPSDPNSVHIFHPSLFLGTWAALREIVLVEGKFPRVDKEVIAAFVSKANECAFCTHTHTLFAESQGNDTAELLNALVEMNPNALTNTKMAKISEWCLQSQKVDAKMGKAPFAKEELPEVLGTAFYFQYMNRVVDTYITRDIYVPGVPGIVKFFMKKSTVFKGFMESKMVKNLGILGRVTTPGESLQLADQEPPLPKELAWASGNDAIARAIAYFAWSVDDLGKAYIPENVTTFVGDYIKNNYTGAKPPLSRKWAFTASESLAGTDEEKLSCAFMLLVSFSRFQIDEGLKNKLQAAFPDSRKFRALGMWAAFQTAKKIAEVQNSNFHDN